MPNYPKPDNATLLEIYRRAALIKTNDEHIIEAMMAGRLITPYYSPRGQEIIPASVSVNLNDDDYLTTIYRGIHDMVAKGIPLKPMWAEIAGRVEGTCKGKGGPMHLTYPKKGIMVTTGVVGSSMPIANGLAWASQVSGDGRVTVANFGDGAANIGAFHESLNMAAVWKLPVIFICQNNRYAEHTSFAKSTAAKKLSLRAPGYGMEGITVDGNDPDEMYGAAKWAIDRARNGEGPTLIEALTYRFNGHVMGDDGHYMDKAEKEKAIANDPMPIFRRRLIDEGIASEEQLTSIEAEITAQISEAAEFALGADMPSVAELKRDVYANELI